MLLRECAKSNVKREKISKKSKVSSKIQAQKVLPYAARFARPRTLAKLSPMIVETFL